MTQAECAEIDSLPE